MKKQKAVVLLQFGGPDSLEAVRPFLFNLFMDADIIKFPGGRLTQRLFAWGITRRRYKKLQEKYSEIGGKSPIVEKTLEQQKALQALLDQRYGAGAIIVELAMRYWNPLTDVAIKSLIEKGITDIVLLPLYAQYSIANAGSSYNEWDRRSAKLSATFNEYRILDYFDNPSYIQGIQEKITQALTKFSDTEGVFILFSAHGTPMYFVEAGDPYSKQILSTVELVMENFRSVYPYKISYQSKVGPRKWLEPDTESTIEALAKSGVKKMLVVPISFVSDHIETSHELDIEAREEAIEAG
ncbi:MAG: ferrochelatase, partial [Ignavibacteriota bacterium]